MTNYSDDSRNTRVDFFKKQDNGSIGKWYTTETLRWEHYDRKEIHVADLFAVALVEHLKSFDEFGKPRFRLADMVAICLSPHHSHAYPMAIAVSEAIDRVSREDVLRKLVAAREVI